MIATWLKTYALVLCGAALLNAGVVSEVAGQTLEQLLLAEPAATLAKAALSDGDAVRGAMIFHHSAVTCVACHSVGDRPSAIGPDLTKIERQTSDTSLVESLLEPSKVIAPAYAVIAVETVDGLIVRGVPVEDTPEKLVLRDAAQPQKLIVLKAAEIAERQPASLSIMPTGQVNLLANRGQFLDLVRYLMALRDGGSLKAREIGRSLESLVQQFPDKPLPNRPVVQRGEVAVSGGAKYPRGIALGFAGGTVLFDADQLSTVATWHDGFVKSTPQNYFGVYMQSAGSAPQLLNADSHPLTIKLAGNENWQNFEAPLLSDPNTGTRFDGYQVGRDVVRLHYHIRVGEQRVRVTEDVRAERLGNWQGFVRVFSFVDLPAGARAAIKLPPGKQAWQASADGKRVDLALDVNDSPFLGYRVGDQQYVVRAQTAAKARWIVHKQEDQEAWQLVSPAATASQPTQLRLEKWKYLGANATIDAEELKELLANTPALSDAFDLPIQPAATLPLVTAADELPASDAPKRLGVNPKENIDEFPGKTGRFLRFVVTGTNDQSAPGLDELEVYGIDPKVNLALQGKASASSAIAGYAIHQIKHLNDGKLGNPNSWISAENNGGWAQIEFPEPVELRRIVWARDRTGTCQDRLAVKYRIEVSSDGQAWTKVGDESGRAPATPFAAGAINKHASPGYEMESIPLPFPGCRPS
ncbi:MAG TPA: discoidin domain-containing protein, partial [Pirellulaceae bacterium]|nr:discoidin domain-containing protein [Pirellulaceae bacterium]